MKELESTVQSYLNSLQSEYKELADCHEVRARAVEHKVLVSCHCSMDGDMPITEVHDLTATLEDRVRSKFPEISRLTIHPEPIDER
jgi:divalent metal cation (Fe/Co/Zn/Cd) transporter